MIKIKEIPLSLMLKFETKNLVNKVADIFEKHNPEALRLQDFHAILQEQKMKVAQLIVPYGEHQLTEVLAHLHQKRLDYASLVLMKLKAFEKVDSKETQELAKTTMRLSKKYLANLGRKSRADVTVNLNSFFSNLKMEVNAEELEAFVSLGMLPYLDDLEMTDKVYNNLIIERGLDIKNRPPIGDVLIEKEAQRILRLFFWQVNAYQETYKEIDYSRLIHDLNIELTANSKTIKTRIATNKRRARKKAEAAAKLKGKDNSVRDNSDKENLGRENS